MLYPRILRGEPRGYDVVMELGGKDRGRTALENIPEPACVARGLKVWKKAADRVTDDCVPLYAGPVLKTGIPEKNDKIPSQDKDPDRDVVQDAEIPGCYSDIIQLSGR